MSLALSNAVEIIPTVPVKTAEKSGKIFSQVGSALMKRGPEIFAETEDLPVKIVGKPVSIFNKIGFALMKRSPEILIAVGVVGVVGSAVLACRATTKISVILEKAKKETDAIRNYEGDEEYTEKDRKKDRAIVYIQTGVKLAKLYGPAVILGTLSLGAIIGSNNILRSRNAALAAAYATVDKGFKEYRQRVVERFGGEVDRELRHNLSNKKIEVFETDDEGNEKKVKKNAPVVNAGDYSGYARFFDEGCNGWSKNPEGNLYFLRGQQAYANDMLRARGYLFLNDVYELLGIPKTKKGQCTGWIYDYKNENAGDNYVDFGIYNAYRECNRDFVNGYEPVILLDFNVDGYILDDFERSANL